MNVSLVSMVLYKTREPPKHFQNSQIVLAILSIPDTDIWLVKSLEFPI